MSIVEAIHFRNYRSIGGRGARISFGHEFIGIIGINNSGKSTVLRAFYELRPVFQSIGGWSITNRAELQNLIGDGQGYGLSLQTGERVFPARNKKAEPRITLELGGLPTHSSSPKQVHLVLSRTGHLRMQFDMPDGSLISHLSNLHTAYNNEIRTEVLRGVDQNGAVREVNWSPIAKAVSSLSSAMYIGPYRNAINAGGNPYYDISVGKDFITQYDEYRSGGNPESNESVREMILRLAEIFGFDRLDIEPSTNNDHLIFMVDGTSLRGSELGAGISQFVIVAANVLVKRPRFLLIDEPELHLHASLQLQFLTLLAQYVPGGVIFSTHSLGLARSAADQMLVATTESDGTNTLLPYNAMPSLSSTLGEMGYGGLNDTAYKAVLLVEGVQDVRTFQQLLIKYGIRSEIVIIPMGGDDLAAGDHGQELAELKRLSDSLFAVADSEKVDSKSKPATRRQTFQKACKEQDINCHLLERRAIENYLDLDIARVVMDRPRASDFDAYSKPSLDWDWDKEKNWRIAQEMELGTIDSTDLGKFLRALSKKVLGAKNS